VSLPAGGPLQKKLSISTGFIGRLNYMTVDLGNYKYVKDFFQDLKTYFSLSDLLFQEVESNSKLLSQECARKKLLNTSSYM
jgi:hypothetical protein